MCDEVSSIHRCSSKILLSSLGLYVENDYVVDHFDMVQSLCIESKKSVTNFEVTPNKMLRLSMTLQL